MAMSCVGCGYNTTGQDKNRMCMGCIDFDGWWKATIYGPNSLMSKEVEAAGLTGVVRDLQAKYPDAPVGIPGLIVSSGGATDYYKLPDHATELRQLMSHKGMSKSRADIFKACYRLGEKDGAPIEYDLQKMKFFVEDLIEMHSRGEHL